MNKYRIGTFPTSSVSGRVGESHAINYLRNSGYVILEKNYRFGRNEVDIICEKQGVVVFVEVKRRLDNKFGSPIEAVDPEKAKKIIKVAQQYLYNRALLGKCKVRFDVIGIQGNELEHIEDAFRE